MEPNPESEIVMAVELPNLPPPISGKVRNIFDLGNDLVIVTTDGISAFDVNMPNGIPDKGKILNQISAYWFEKFAKVCPHHMISVDDQVIAERLGYTKPDPQLVGRSMLVKKAKPLKIECVVRGFIAGSLHEEYRQLHGKVRDLDLPLGLLDGDRLPKVLFTPATKATEGHDVNISFADAAKLVGGRIAKIVRDWSIELYIHASYEVGERGLILADTKFEFGETDDGIIWIDEALTPDSSRFWDPALYHPGQSQPSFDKQFLRDYLEAIGWNKQPPAPELPREIIEQIRERYLEAYRRITGREFVA